jgi:hypothetical protein
MVNTIETTHLESIDEILRNLKANPNYYSNPKEESTKMAMWMNEERF